MDYGVEMENFFNCSDDYKIYGTDLNSIIEKLKNKNLKVFNYDEILKLIKI